MSQTSKYNALWKYVQDSDEQALTLTFDDVEKVAGIPLDHSFLTYKKELIEYGLEVEKISLKHKTVQFRKID